MDELDFPDFGGEVVLVAPDYWRCGWSGCWPDSCDGARSVLGTDIGLALEDCDGVQIEVVA